MLSTIPNSFGDPHYCNIENENFCQQKNRLKGRTAEGGEMIRACACGAKLFAALEYEQPGRLRPAGSRLQFSANKKNRLKGGFFCWWRCSFQIRT